MSIQALRVDGNRYFAKLERTEWSSPWPRPFNQDDIAKEYLGGPDSMMQDSLYESAYASHGKVSTLLQCGQYSNTCFSVRF